jgi:hypothetical protein
MVMGFVLRMIEMGLPFTTKREGSKAHADRRDTKSKLRTVAASSRCGLGMLDRKAKRTKRAREA